MISPFPAFPEGKTVKEQVFLEKDLSLPTFFRESRPKNFTSRTPLCGGEVRRELLASGPRSSVTLDPSRARRFVAAKLGESC